jgi:hypothetical protein
LRVRRRAMRLTARRMLRLVRVMAEMAVFIMVSFCNDAIAETENCAGVAIGTPGTGVAAQRRTERLPSQDRAVVCAK